MSIVNIPAGYHSALNLYDTQTAIGKIKRIFEDKLSKALNLKRVSAPLFVDPKSGLNDDLSGIERPVHFSMKETGTDAHVVHSLAKWKRMALHNYDFHPGNGLYTDMNAIRRDEEMSNVHSVYVDQWDWEKVLPAGRRDEQYLHETVQAIVDAICDTWETIKAEYPDLPDPGISRQTLFITTQELEDRYPDLTPKERENALLKEHTTVFLEQIGDKLNSGERHDGRAPDYDDWQLNGDLLFWNPVLKRALELSSMGIRVDARSMDEQLNKAGCNDRRELPFHKMLLNDELPLTIGGGIGQSRLCLLLLSKAHIGEVQCSIWDEQTRESCRQAGVILL